MPASRRKNASNRIVYIDDDGQYALLLKSALERLGHSVTTHWDPKAALQDILRQPEAWDLVISDYSMSGVTGFDVARAIRKRQRQLPCAVISSHVTDVMVKEAPACGVWYLSIKPTTPQEFSELIDGALEGKRPQ